MTSFYLACSLGSGKVRLPYQPVNSSGDLCHGWKTPEWACSPVYCLFSCAFPVKMRRWALKATHVGYVLVTTPFPQSLPLTVFPFLALVNWIFLSPTIRGKKFGLQIHSHTGGVENSSFPKGIFVCTLAPVTSHLICIESESKLGVRLEFGNSVLAERRSEQNQLFLCVLIPSGLACECVTEKEILLTLTTLLYFLVLNLQNSGIRKCLQKGFEEVTEAEVCNSAALSMDKQNIVTYFKEKRA